jgi:hypothetical protein
MPGEYQSPHQGSYGKSRLTMQHAPICSTARPWQFAVVLVFHLFLLMSRCAAQDELLKPTDLIHVTVRCARPDILSGLPVRVLTQDKLRGGLVAINDKTLLDPSGQAELDLPAGSYVFEVLAAKPTGIVVSVHSPPTAVTKEMVVNIPVDMPQPVTLLNGDWAMDIEQLALRSESVCDEARWTRNNTTRSPYVLLSPKQICNANVVALSGSTHVAAWVKIGGTESTHLQVKQDWNQCKFVWRDKTPPIKQAVVHIDFPVGELEFELRPNTQLITNRRFLMIGYTVHLTSGPILQFHGTGTPVALKQNFELGGELTPHAWAGFVWSEEGSGWVPHFRYRADLLDPNGQDVDIYSKDSGVKWSIIRNDGKKLADDVIDNDYIKQLGKLPQALTVTMQWTWGQQRSQPIPVEECITLRSEHFKLQGIPFWAWESRNYLSKMERYYQIERTATGRPGPASIDVNWRENQNNAKAMVGGLGGGAQWMWYSVPFRGYEDNHDPFNEPTFVGHEMLHTFGYNHGDEMAKMQHEVEGIFADYRWYIQDHPTQTVTIVPEQPMDNP